MAGGGTVKGRSWGGARSSACRSRGRVEEPGRRRAVYGKVLGRRIRFVYSQIHRSLQVSEFGQKCPAFQQLETISSIPQGIHGHISCWVYSVVPVARSVGDPCLCLWTVLPLWNKHLSSFLSKESQLLIIELIDSEMCTTCDIRPLRNCLPACVLLFNCFCAFFLMNFVLM